ncbi:hypothetical protein D3C81_2309260 [compost metagenome]
MQGGFAVIDVELAKQIVDVGFHRAEANIESVGNLLVALAVGHPPQYILLAAGQWLEQQLGFARALRERCA